MQFAINLLHFVIGCFIAGVRLRADGQLSVPEKHRTVRFPISYSWHRVRRVVGVLHVSEFEYGGRQVSRTTTGDSIWIPSE